MMHSEFRIYLNQVSYTNDKPLFTDLNLSLSAEKSGLTGKNGAGKSTLLRLIAGELTPTAGTIQITGKIAYCPQEFHVSAQATVADVLGIADKINALDHIIQGSLDSHYFTELNDQWDIRERAYAQLALFDLAHLALDRLFHSLSGGEQTRLYLVKTFLTDADFLILDEPTNNLDAHSRQLLYHAIQQWQKGLLIVSHDRELLNLMEQIIELTTLGIQIFGGNFSDYLEQKNNLTAAHTRQLFDAQKALNKTRSGVQASREKHEKRQAQGRRLRKSGSQATIILDNMKERSTRSQGEALTKHHRMLENAQEKLTAIKEKIEITEEINLALPETYVPNGKMILDMEQVCFRYPSSSQLLIDHFNLKIQGAEHIALRGKNGSGKTTLVKLIMGELQPLSGKIYLGTSYISYLDQHTRLLNPSQSILENFLILNPDANEHDAHIALAKFLFKNVAAKKLVCDLSGGEKLRALLACVLSAKHPPQLLILDEPTNHLDLASIAKIEAILKNFQGALIVISHDGVFLENVGMDQYIDLSY